MPLSEKQRAILAFPYTHYDALICDGAIRSGKTTVMTLSFIDWAMRDFNGQRFGICGKTVDSSIKNIIFRILMPFLLLFCCLIIPYHLPPVQRLSSQALTCNPLCQSHPAFSPLPFPRLLSNSLQVL